MLKIIVQREDGTSASQEEIRRAVESDLSRFNDWLEKAKRGGKMSRSEEAILRTYVLWSLSGGEGTL